MMIVSLSFFDNPKTNLTYEKNLCYIIYKYCAKHFSKVNHKYKQTKHFTPIA